MSILRTATLLLAISAIILLQGCGRDDGPTVSFKDQVMPILQEKCLSCHVPGGLGHQRSGLLLDSHANILKGSNNGPILTPGDTNKSPISVFIHPNPDVNLQMPLGGKNKLTKTEVDIIDSWINQGAMDN